MKIHIPAFEPKARCNEHLRHGAFDIDLGDDVVQVVRCKDCQYYDSGECVNPNVYMSDGAHLYTAHDDFCSYGERRNGDE